MTEIKCTKDYGLFKKHESNRAIDNANLKRIKNSMKAKNLLNFKPILVDNEFRVLDGQHRLQAAKELMVEVYYQVHNEAHSEDIILINAHQKKWGAEDYLNFFVSKGKEDYIKVKQWCGKHDISLADYLRMDPAYKMRCGGSVNMFFTGLYKFPDDEQMKIQADIITAMKRIFDKLNSIILEGRTFIKAAGFKRGLMKFLQRDDVNLETFLIKLTYKSDAIHGCADIKGYVDMFTKIYNWKNSNPIILFPEKSNLSD